MLASWSSEWYTCVSCFCPCVLIGNITSKIDREKPFPCCTNAFCFDFQMGTQGCRTCSWACIAAALGWPCSPFLACYLARERWKLKLFYKDDDRLKPGTWSTFLLWPTNLRDQHRFVRDIAQDGSLTFRWDLDLFQDQMLSRPDYLAYTMFLFGPDTEGEREFVRKLMVHADHALPASVDLPEVRSVEKIKTCSRPLPVEKGMIRMLEIWQVPPCKHRAGALRAFLAQASIAIFLLDLGAPETLLHTKEAYEYQTDYVVCSKLIVILKPPTSAPTSTLEDEAIAWARKTTCVWFLVGLTHELEIYKLNREINKLLKRDGQGVLVSSVPEPSLPLADIPEGADRGAPSSTAGPTRPRSLQLGFPRRSISGTGEPLFFQRPHASEEEELDLLPSGSPSAP